MSIFRLPCHPSRLFFTFLFFIFFPFRFIIIIIIVIHTRAPEPCVSLLLYRTVAVRRHVFITNSNQCTSGGCPLCARRVRMRNRCGVPRVSGRSTGSVMPKFLATTPDGRRLGIRFLLSRTHTNTVHRGNAL